MGEGAEALPVTGSLAWPFTPAEGLAEAWRRIAVEAATRSGTLDIGGLQLDEAMLGELAPAIARLDWLQALYLGAGADARKKSWFDLNSCNFAHVGCACRAVAPRLG